MGNRFSRRRDVTINSAETAATEQKAAEKPAATQPGEDSGMTLTQKVETENLDVVVGEPVTPVACLPTEECVSEYKEVEAPAASAPLNDTEAEPEAKETPAPVQPEPLVSVNEPSPPEPEPVPEQKPVAEPAPEPVQEPEPTSNPEVNAEAVPKPISEPAPAPAEALEQETDLPVISTPPLVDLGAPDVTPQLIDTSPSPSPIPVLVNADEPSDTPATEKFQDSAEAAVISPLEPEKSEETSESVEKPMEAEAAGNLDQLVSDVNEESVSGLLKHLELTGNDLVTDLIHSDVKIPDDTPIVDISTSTELM